MAGIDWDPLLTLTYLSAFLIAATILRTRLAFLQKFLISNSIIAVILE